MKQEQKRPFQKHRVISHLAFAQLFLMFAMSIPLSQASEPPATPMLRLENGMHVTRINRIDIDASERFVLTASTDKTARLWNLSDGSMLRTFRVPQANSNEGKLFASALSRDGDTVALAGLTGWTWDEKISIYLFSRADGRLLQRLTGLPDIIEDLAFSTDGRFLAAVSVRGGISVFETTSGREVFADHDYGGASFSVDFAADGRLLATSYDGQLYLYGADFHLIAKRAAPGGKRVYSARFSPNGHKLAVGYEGSTAINILSTDDLRLLYSADTGEEANGNLAVVAWSHDGETLYAGGGYLHNGDNSIAYWNNQGQAPVQWLVPATENTVFDLKALHDGSVVYASAEPSLGKLKRDGQIQWQQRGQLVDFRGIYKRSLLLSGDGQRIQFGYAYAGQQPALFDLAQRRLSLDPAADSSLNAPNTTALALSDWEDTSAKVNLNGHPLVTSSSDISRSAAIAPDRRHLLLGSEHSLFWFDADGRQVWSQPMPAPVWGVNVAGNGRVGVAALGDGTLRWYRLSDGKELLAFYPHPDKQRWVLWTPDGYYDASPGAEELIGWHVNRGKDQAADFFAIGRFRDTYYRPDVVARMLETLDGGEALRLANLEANKRQTELDLRRQLPPVITVLSPSDGGTFSQEQVTVRFNLRSPSGEPVTAVKALVDGRPVSQQRGMTRPGQGDGQSDSLTLALPPRDVELTLVAENRYASSEPSTVRLRWTGAAAGEFIVKPKLYVLSVGTSRYDNPALTLGYAAKDAADFAREISRQKSSGLYRDVVVQQVIDGDKNAILDGLDWLQREVTAKDVAMLFMAGHGVNDRSGTYYYLPKEADTERLKRTGLPYYAIKDTISNLPGKVLYFLDTCHSGNVMGGRRGANDINGVINELTSAENGIVVFAASSGNQYSLEDAAWGNGAFTKALLEGLGGQADFRGSGRITVNMLDLYLSERVKALTRGQQTPTTTKPATVPDFPVVVR